MQKHNNITAFFLLNLKNIFVIIDSTYLPLLKFKSKDG